MRGFQASLADNGSGGKPAPSPSARSSGSDAAAVIGARCGSCHSPEAAPHFHASSAEQAKALNDQMLQQGASVPTAEEQTLIDYFTR